MVLGQPLIATAVAVQPHSSSSAAVGDQATTTVYTYRLPVLQLQKNQALHQRFSPAQAGQCTMCSSNQGEPT
jgi:hypothetical protein